MGQESRSGHATLDRTARSRSLHDSFAMRAAQFGTHMANHKEARRHVLQHLRHLLPACATPRRNPGMPIPLARAFAFDAEDVRVADGGLVLQAVLINKDEGYAGDVD